MLDKGEAEKYDFAFIDADKPNYIHYYELCMKLVRQGGIIAVDNVCLLFQIKINYQLSIELVQPD